VLTVIVMPESSAVANRWVDRCPSSTLYTSPPSNGSNPAFHRRVSIRTEPLSVVFVFDHAGCAVRLRPTRQGQASFFSEEGRVIVAAARSAVSGAGTLLRVGHRSVSIGRKSGARVRLGLRKTSLRPTLVRVRDAGGHPVLGVLPLPRYSGFSAEEQHVLALFGGGETGPQGTITIGLPLAGGPVDVFNQDGRRVGGATLALHELRHEPVEVRLASHSDVVCATPGYIDWTVQSCLNGPPALVDRFQGGELRRRPPLPPVHPGGGWAGLTSAAHPISTGIAFFWLKGARWHLVRLTDAKGKSVGALLRPGDPCNLSPSNWSDSRCP
jgi:hypothetical protein